MPGYSSKKRRFESETGIQERSREEGDRTPKKQRQDFESFGNGNGRLIRPHHGNNESKRNDRAGHVRSTLPTRPEQNGRLQRTFLGNKHRKSYRTTNPSTRITSLRKQLNHQSAATMPADLLADKERELAYLESEQKQTQTTKDRSRMIGRYHKVRFFERRKAERNLRRLRRTIQPIEDDEVLPEAVPLSASDLHRAETDLIYTLYTPLEEKYIAIFAADKSDTSTRKDKKNKSIPMKTADQGREITQLSDATNDMRPARWHEVAEILKRSQSSHPAEEEAVKIPAENEPLSAVRLTSSQLRRLETLRDGRSYDKFNSSTADDVVIGSKDKRPAQNGVQVPRPTVTRRRPAWQTSTDKTINPMDADGNGDADESGHGATTPMVKANDEESESESDSESQSDGDGGFFEQP